MLQILNSSKQRLIVEKEKLCRKNYKKHNFLDKSLNKSFMLQIFDTHKVEPSELHLSGFYFISTIKPHAT